MDRKVQFHTLAGMRGVAAAFVVILHFGIVHVPLAGNAVDLFFVLSGVVIEHSYGGTFRRSFRTFMKARALRLYPLFFLGMTFGALGALGNPAHAALLWGLAVLCLPVLTGNDALYPLDHPAYSLLLEIIVNVMWAMTRIGWLLIGIALAILLVDNCFMARACFGFFLGTMMRRHQLENWRPGGGWACMAVLAVMLSVQAKWMQMPLIVLGQPLLIWWAMHTRPVRGIGLMELAGDVSYPLYILHVPLAVLLISQHGFIPGPLWMRAGFGCVVVVIAWGFDRFYDRPVRRWLGRRRGWLLTRRKVEA